MSPSVHPTAPVRVQRIGIVGAVSVGKTCLFDRLTLGGEHSVHVPGSTSQTKRGVLSVGVGAAPAAYRRHCATCGTPRGLGRHAKVAGCTADSRADGSCPAVAGSHWLWPWRAATRAASAARPPLATASAADSVVTHLFDTPGSANLAAAGEDEMVARDLLLSGELDAVLFVADAKSVRRSLALALQIAEFGLPMVLDLNMVDEAENVGVDVDDARLSRDLGIPVARTVAVDGFGVRKLSELLLNARAPKHDVPFPQAIEQAIAELEALLDNPIVPARAVSVLLLSGDAAAGAWVAEHLGATQLQAAREIVARVAATFRTPLEVLIADGYQCAAARLAERVTVESASSPNLLVSFGAWAQRPLPGAFIALAVLALAYFWVGSFGAAYLVDDLSTSLFQKVVLPACGRLVAWIPSAFVRDAIMDPNFGVLSTGLFAAVGVVLPILFCFYVLQALLEDSGYLPRLAILFDRILRRIGLNGQAFIPIMLGFSCVAMSVLTARMLPSRKERALLTLLVVGVPCAPLLAVMLVILRRMPWSASALLGGVLFLRLVATGYIANRLMGGARPDLILELPRMRIPRPRVLLSKTWRRTWHFVSEALPLFLAASLAVFLFDRVGGLAVAEKLARPFVSGPLGLPDASIQVFLAAAFRRENGATKLNLLYGQFTNVQLVVTLLLMTFVMPCLNTTVLIVKERGLKAAVTILAVAAISGLTIGAAVHWTCAALGVTLS